MRTSDAPQHSTRTQVAIIGAGPAGLTLAHMLAGQGIDAVVLERQTEDHVRSRVRAGVIENSTVNVLTELGVADRLHREALVHKGFYIRLDRTTHHLDFHRLSGRNAYVYGQAEIVADLIDGLRAVGREPVFRAEEVSLHDFDGTAPSVEYMLDGVRHRVDADVIAACDGFHGVAGPHSRRTRRLSNARIPLPGWGFSRDPPRSPKKACTAPTRMVCPYTACADHN